MSEERQLKMVSDVPHLCQFIMGIIFQLIWLKCTYFKRTGTYLFQQSLLSEGTGYFLEETRFDFFIVAGGICI